MSQIFTPPPTKWVDNKVVVTVRLVTADAVTDFQPSDYIDVLVPVSTTFNFLKAHQITRAGLISAVSGALAVVQGL